MDIQSLSIVQKNPYFASVFCEGSAAFRIFLLNPVEKTALWGYTYEKEGDTTHSPLFNRVLSATAGK